MQEVSWPSEHWLRNPPPPRERRQQPKEVEDSPTLPGTTAQTHGLQFATDITAATALTLVAPISTSAVDVEELTLPSIVKAPIQTVSQSSKSDSERRPRWYQSPNLFPTSS